MVLEVSLNKESVLPPSLGETLLMKIFDTSWLNLMDMVVVGGLISEFAKLFHFCYF